MWWRKSRSYGLVPLATPETNAFRFPETGYPCIEVDVRPPTRSERAQFQPEWPGVVMRSVAVVQVLQDGFEQHPLLTVTLPRDDPFGMNAPASLPHANLHGMSYVIRQTCDSFWPFALRGVMVEFCADGFPVWAVRILHDPREQCDGHSVTIETQNHWRID